MTDESTDPPVVKDGWRTTEFYVAVFSLLAPLMTLAFHRDFSQEVQALAVASAAFVNGAYALGRAIVKAAHSSAAGQVQSAAIRSIATKTV